MKRNDLLRQLRLNGCCLKRESSSHSLWASTLNGKTEAIPRHDEISENLARKILKNLIGIAK